MHEVTTDERGGWQADEGGSAGLLFVVEAKRHLACGLMRRRLRILACILCLAYGILGIVCWRPRAVNKPTKPFLPPRHAHSSSGVAVRLLHARNTGETPAGWDDGRHGVSALSALWDAAIAAVTSGRSAVTSSN
jgi:hypothetical protein